MAQLAIKGHATRGREVIELLEMLGGINKYNLRGSEDEWFVLNGTLIQRSDRLFVEKGFPIEEFLEKFPYKVEDKIIYKSEVSPIIGMKWDCCRNIVIYTIKTNCSIIDCYDSTWIKPYKEEAMEERQYKELRIPLDDDDKLATEVTIDGNKILPPNGYLIGKITQLDNGMFVEYVKKQPQYPKTYEECCKILDISPHNSLCLNTYVIYDYVSSQEERMSDKISSLYRLLVCRDAYWKIAGEQMGLGKPWKPDWKDDSDKYFICYLKDELWMSNIKDCNRLLVFPTEEMQEAFYENFKDLIETCKELL